MTVYFQAAKRWWRYDFRLDGRRYTGAGYKTKAEARAAEAERRKDLQAGRSAVYSTFAELVDDYLASSQRTKSEAWVYQLKAKLNKGFGHLADLPLCEIRLGHLERALNDLARTNGARSVNEYRKMVRAVFAYALRLEAVDRNPAAGLAKVPEPAAEARVISTADLRALILAAGVRDRALLTFLAQTGARWIEAARLTWGEVDVTGAEPFCILTTRKTRGGHARKRPQALTGAACRAIESVRGLDPALVFPSLSGGPALYETDRKRLHRICERAGVEPVSFHALRHWAGLQATAAGKSRKAVADFLGHTSTAVTERYMHALRPEIWDVARRLEEALDLAAEAPQVSAER